MYYLRYKVPVFGSLLIRHYYNSGRYEKDVQKICEKAINYFSKIPVTENSLVIFDVDDTAVYNLRFRKFIGMQLPPTVAILPVLKLYQYLIQRGFKVVFLTSRDFCEDTEKELIEAGYTKFIGIICMPEDLSDDYSGIWKAEKRHELSKKYTIEGSIADRDRDFFDSYSGYAVKLPNYLYN